MGSRRALSTLAGTLAIGLLVVTSPLGCGAEPPRAAPGYELSPGRPGDLVPIAAGPASSGSAIAGAGEAPGPLPAPLPATPQRFAVAAESPTASRAAIEILRKGGSAADAAIAAALTAGITQPVSSGIGGGGFAIVWDAKAGKATALDFRETAPIGIVRADHARRPSGDKKRDRKGDKNRGVMVGVPGEVAGLCALHARWGKLAQADLWGGAAEIADAGFPVSAHMARSLTWNAAWVSQAPGYAFWQRPTGGLVGAGDMVKNPALAATLRRIAAEGPKAFYEGVIGADVVATARDAGSHITAQDLKGYQVAERAPLRARWEGYDVVTMPPPSAGGVMLLETLAMHGKADLTALGYGTAAYYHLLAETFRGAIADRVRKIGDPAFARQDPAALTDPARMKARRARMSLDSTTPAEKFPLEEAGTSHVVVRDAEGNVVSITTSVNDMFGAKLVAQGGFVLNDALDAFSPAELEARFGPGRGPNSPRGGARPTSSMTPTLVLLDGAPVLSLGGSGGSRIATGVTQVLLASLVFGRTAAQAVADARIETPFMGGLLLDPAPNDVAVDLRRRGEIVDTTRANFSAVQALAIRGGALEAAADPRKGGLGIVE